MINAKDNALINAKLAALYEKNTTEFLRMWSDAFKETPPCRINEFGIIDIHRYNTTNGILFIGRETNGWSDEDYESGCLFRSWMREISQNGLKGRGHIKKHPNMWYNIGRWALLLQSPNMSIDDLVLRKEEAINAIGTIAFTNINKVRGRNAIGKEYNHLAYTEVVQQMIRDEISIIKPKVIVCCGTWRPVAEIVSDFEGKIIFMPHPGARKSTKKMLQDLKEQSNREGL